ncbi:MAG: methylcobamide--CoM methyltransferase MtbA, partial [bacterium]|nr:methylcobamide--CoM methyltransferase MtbA [bacterium]
MSPSTMSSMERTLTTLGHREPDRVPCFLFPTMHGAKEVGLTIREYFEAAENVVEGQLRLRTKYRSDCVSPFFHAAIEVEAWGGEVVYRDDGPPNSGRPFLSDPEAIRCLEAPAVNDCPCLQKVLKATEMLKDRVGDDVPIIGVAVSPFSLPVMQLGFDKYLALLIERSDTFARLMAVNEEFCVEWANAQLEAGATAICYFDPLSSTTLVPRTTYLETGFEVAKRTLARIKGPTATHMASGRCLPIMDDLAQTGTAGIGVSALEDLTELKAAAQGRLAVLGNLNGIEMRRWTPSQAEAAVKSAIAKAG